MSPSAVPLLIFWLRNPEIRLLDLRHQWLPIHDPLEIIEFILAKPCPFLNLSA